MPTLLSIQVGQYLSARPDLVPEDYIKVLSRCQDKVVAPPAADVTAVVEKELGKKMDQLFHSVASEALAAASIASVWKATLRNTDGSMGEDVVIKVQHKRVREIVLQDLQDFKAICSGQSSFAGCALKQVGYVCARAQSEYKLFVLPLWGVE